MSISFARFVVGWLRLSSVDGDRARLLLLGAMSAKYLACSDRRAVGRNDSS